jgi:hypothetical protein
MLRVLPSGDRVPLCLGRPLSLSGVAPAVTVVHVQLGDGVACRVMVPGGRRAERRGAQACTGR